ncbi:hypothetical protein PaeBR_06215 [Paenibacillus sp. BR2-3]|uniref:hypothetical protein n=1 Tax=Paenibacillus sp. BR2-3 TaxID=3048494 RepID=UPI00397789D5
MEYLKLLPIPSAIGWFGSFMLLIYFIDFFRTTPAARLLESSKTGLLRKISKDIIIYLIVTVLILFFASPSNNSALMIPLFIGIIITTVLGLIYTEAKNSRIQLLINKVIIKVVKTKAFRYYRLTLSLIHTLMIINAYWLFVTMTLSGFKDTLNVDVTNNFDILLYSYEKNKYIIYAFIVLSGIMFFVFQKMYMYPINKIFSEIFNSVSKGRIKLTSGEVLHDLYIFQTSDTKFLLASNDLNISGASKTYHIHRDKIDYIETSSSSKIIDFKQQDIKRIT